MGGSKIIDHPNFKLPDVPVKRDSMTIALWALEAAAMLVSPPKVDHEDEEFECDDVAAAIRGPLGQMVMRALRNSPSPKDSMAELKRQNDGLRKRVRHTHKCELATMHCAKCGELSGLWPHVTINSAVLYPPIYRKKTHQFKATPCSCGLDVLLRVDS